MVFPQCPKITHRFRFAALAARSATELATQIHSSKLVVAVVMSSRAGTLMTRICLRSITSTKRTTSSHKSECLPLTLTETLPEVSKWNLLTTASQSLQIRTHLGDCATKVNAATNAVNSALYCSLRQTNNWLSLQHLTSPWVRIQMQRMSNNNRPCSYPKSLVFKPEARAIHKQVPNRTNTKKSRGHCERWQSQQILSPSSFGRWRQRPTMHWSNHWQVRDHPNHLRI